MAEYIVYKGVYTVGIGEYKVYIEVYRSNA